MPTTERRQFEDEFAQAGMALAHRFVNRWDLYAKQLPDGRYVTIHEPLTTSHILAHLRGELTLGTYLLNEKNLAHFIVLDADTHENFLRLAKTAQQLTAHGLPNYLEASRRGGHVWLFFEQPVGAKEARQFGKGILATGKVEGIEVYPKQDKLVDGPGSLIRMPFGVHRKNGKRYSFYTPDGKRLGQTITDQALLLSHPLTVSNIALSAYQIAPEAPIKGKETMTPVEGSESLSTQIKRSISLVAFISQYVELSSTGVGKCPFHDDEHPSFAVNTVQGYWHCFAGCGGGSIIDFWMKLQKCDFTTAIRELAEFINLNTLF